MRKPHKIPSVTRRPSTNVSVLAICAALVVGCSRSADSCFDDSQSKSLVRAIERGDLDEIDRLVTEGADVNATGTKLDMRVAVPLASPLMVAMRANRPEAFERLLERGANPNQQVGGVSPLSLAAKWSASMEFLKLALEHGGDPNLVNPNDGETPIFNAIGYRCDKNVELLIEAGADLNHQGNSGGTPMIRAAGMNRFDIAYRLLEAGADYRPKSKAGNDLAYELIDTTVSPDHEYNRWRLKLIKILEERGVDFEAVKKEVQKRKEERERNKDANSSIATDYYTRVGRY